MPFDEVKIAQDLAEAGDWDNAYRLCVKNLRDEPDSFVWLMVLTYIMLGTEKPEIAYQVGKRVTQLKPNEAGGWMNLGMAAKDIWQDEESLRCFRRGLKFAKTPESRSMLYVNAASVLVDTGRFSEAESYCLDALKINPESVKARANLGFCQLAQRNWSEGWKNYRLCMGHDWRPLHQYNKEPIWDGKSKGTIAVYGEQGLGDQISFAQMLPDMKAWCDANDSRLIVDINPRLGNLIRRSFPDIKVYGTQNDNVLKWDKEDQSVDYSIPMGQLAEYYRLRDEDFSGERYLVPDAERVLQWRALFASKQKPVIGLAWSGGIPKTGSKFRRVDLETLLPLLRSVDACWVSLQYKSSAKEIAAFKKKHPDIDIVEYPHGTLSNDYDDTVAMVAALDHVVAVHTTINHVSGGLGVPTSVMVPLNSQWRYGQGYEDFPWAKSIKLFRQTRRCEWGDVVQKLAGEIRELFPKKAGRQSRVRHLPPKAQNGSGKVLGESRQVG